MAESEKATHEEQQDDASGDSGAVPTAAPSTDDQAHRTAPPGNPDTDREAVEKGEENIGRVAGR